MTEDYLEKRKTARLDIPIKVEYRVIGVNAPKAALTANISAGGCLLVSDEALPPDAVVELDIYLGSSDSEILKLKGTVVRVAERSSGTHEYGISFSEMSNSAKRLFADFCFSKMYEMIGLSEWPTAKKP